MVTNSLQVLVEAFAKMIPLAEKANRDGYSFNLSFVPGKAKLDAQDLYSNYSLEVTRLDEFNKKIKNKKLAEEADVEFNKLTRAYVYREYTPLTLAELGVEV